MVDSVAKTRPSKVREYVFAACRQGEHEDCADQMVVEDQNDLSKPRELHRCSCKHHQKSKVEVEYRMLLVHCSNCGDHKKCPGSLRDEKDKLTLYICSCKCHRQENTVVE